MQIHANSKGKVALDDITLRVNRCTKCHGNTISRFHLTAHYESGGEFQKHRLVDHVPLILDILNPKSIGLDRTWVFVLSYIHTDIVIK